MNDGSRRLSYASGLLLIVLSAIGIAFIVGLLSFANAYGQGGLPNDPTVGSSLLSSSISGASGHSSEVGASFLGPILNSLGTSIGWSYLFGILLFLGALVVVVFLVFLLGGLVGFSRIKNGDGKWLKIVPAMGVVEGVGWLIVAFFIAFVTVNYWFLSLLLIGVGEIVVAAMSLVALRKNR